MPRARYQIVPRSSNMIKYGVPAAGTMSRMAWGRARAVIQRQINKQLRNRAQKAIRNAWNKHRLREEVNKRARKRRKVTKTTTIRGSAQGPTYTTTRMIVRKTPGRQKFLRKLFKTNPIKTMYVNRFGFAWMGASAASKTIWYSATSLKYNNLKTFMKSRTIHPQQGALTQSGIADSQVSSGNSPDAYIYLGKCTYSYEIYNPTNYIVTVYIYDLICKRDTPYSITYGEANQNNSSAPENMMMKSADYATENNLTNGGQTWTIADPTVENNTYWNSIGMKPTDYHYFNTFWKVKGMKKIILPPTTAHHHIVVFNPKSKITNASLYMPRQHIDHALQDKCGIAGLTISTLFGFQGQVAVENDQVTDSSNKVGTLPGKLIISMVKKENVYSGEFTTTQIYSDSNLQSSLTNPTIFTDLVEQTATAT